MYQLTHAGFATVYNNKNAIQLFIKKKNYGGGKNEWTVINQGGPSASRLTHPNIVQLLETFEDKHKVYLVMEL